MMPKYIVKEQEGLISKFIGAIFGSVAKQAKSQTIKKLQSTEPEFDTKIKDLEKGSDDIDKYIKKTEKSCKDVIQTWQDFNSNKEKRWQLNVEDRTKTKLKT